MKRIAQTAPVWCDSLRYNFHVGVRSGEIFGRGDSMRKKQHEGQYDTPSKPDDLEKPLASPSGSESQYEFDAFENGKRVRLSAEERHLLKTTFCEICGGLLPFSDNPIILCDGHRCNKAYHIKCMTPPLTDVPKGDFRGPCCEASKRTVMRPIAPGLTGRGHLRRIRLINRSHGTENVDSSPLSNPIHMSGLFSQFGQSFTSRRKSNLVESIEDLPATAKERPSEISIRSPSNEGRVQSSSEVMSNWHSSLMDSHQQLIEDLRSIVGMERVKELLIDINCKINLRKERIRRSSSGSSSSGFGGGMAPHIALIGNPGTGKSMIGRILAKMLHRSNAVKRNIFVKAHRSDLVAGFLGQTALKTSQLIEQARGGIMFVDEAHQLINPNKEDYGIEAYREIMREMLSDHAVDEDRVLFIFAGYPKQMNRFLGHDAGMESRISFRIHLPDYTIADLSQICESKIKNTDPHGGLPTQMEEGVDLEQILTILPSELLPRYNARIVDLILDKAEACLARRMLSSLDPVGVADIFKLNLIDFKNACVALRREMLHACSSPSPSESGNSSSNE